LSQIAHADGIGADPLRGGKYPMLGVGETARLTPLPDNIPNAQRGNAPALPPANANANRDRAERHGRRSRSAELQCCKA
jgi:hypothetical protein